ncbi:hypothetical protein ACFV0T_41495 [Streptomyces sp. NPDC059582]|uniref:hypothetical protein n=1 Tax=Streptomyces sp. NPDC059582 TaxID=3346875 RepID=UPI0036AE1090
MEAGTHPAAARVWQRLIHQAELAHGRLASTTLRARDGHAWCVGEGGDAARAVQLLRQVLADTAESQLPQTSVIRTIRLSLAWWIGEAGDPAEAVRRLRSLLDTAAQQLDADGRKVRLLRHALTHWCAVAGPPDEAQSLLEANLDEMARSFPATHLLVRACRRDRALRRQQQA